MSKYNKEKSKQHYQEHRAELIEKSKKWYHDHFPTPESRKDFNIKRKENYHINLKKYKQEVYNKLGNKCVHCGITDLRVLQIDHLNGGGETERNKFRYQPRFYKHILNNIQNYQLLCANCNWIKRWHEHEAERLQEAAKLKAERQRIDEEMKKRGVT